MTELEMMKETMEKMEQERADMVAEIEAQIERALASMVVGIEDSDYGGSRPGSRSSLASGTTRSRRTSDAGKTRHLRSFGTESTLAEAFEESAEEGEGAPVDKLDRQTNTIEEGDEEEAPLSPSKKKRFSASEVDMPQDGMNAVDEGISEKSDTIAQKVLEIQQKVRLISPQAKHGLTRKRM